MGKEGDAEKSAPSEQRRVGGRIPIPKVHHRVRKGAYRLLFAFIGFNMILQCKYNDTTYNMQYLSPPPSPDATIASKNTNNIFVKDNLYDAFNLNWFGGTLTFEIKQ